MNNLTGHEAGHVVAAIACGLSINSATIIKEKGRAGSVRLTPNDYTCKALSEFSDIPLQEVAGAELGFGTKTLCYARTIVMLAGQEAERLLFPDQDPYGCNQGDMQSAAFLVNTITGTSKAALALIDFARADAKRILIANMNQVEAVAEALLEHKTLNAEDIAVVISGKSLGRKRWDAMAAGAAQFMAMTGGLQLLAI